MTAVATPRPDARIRLTFPRVIRSEWIKLRSLRSTWWTASVTVALVAGIGVLVAWAFSVIPEEERVTVPGVMAIGVGYTFAQLVVGVLGVLVMTGEYSTGLQRTTFAAVPRRLRVYAAKAVVVTAWTAVLVALGVALAVAIAQPILVPAGIGIDLGDAEQLRSLGGQVLYLVLVALFALGIGALVRHAAAGIVIVVGTFFALPIVVQMVGMLARLDWIVDAYRYLPSVAGAEIMSTGSSLDSGLGPWAGLGLLAAYTAAALVAGGIAIARRDD